MKKQAHYEGIGTLGRYNGEDFILVAESQENLARIWARIFPDASSLDAGKCQRIQVLGLPVDTMEQRILTIEARLAEILRRDKADERSP